MYPPRFRYERPASLDDVIGLLSSGRGEAKDSARARNFSSSLMVSCLPPYQER